VEDESSRARPDRDELIAVLYHRHRAALVRLAVGLVGDVGEAEEIVQDAFAGLLSRWRSLRDVQSAPAYLHAAVVNGARARWRRRAIRERAWAVIGRAAPTAGPDVAEQSSLLTAIRRLPVGKRACILLRFYADMSEAETAAVLGISVGTVKSQTSRALTRLAELLEAQEAERTDDPH
jgi:RNA polymerase sigma-70 factor (sigma-E family)